MMDFNSLFRGNLLMTPDMKLAFIDFGMMADVNEEDRYGLVGLVIGLQNKDLPLITENLLKVFPIANLWKLHLRIFVSHSLSLSHYLSSVFSVIQHSWTNWFLDFELHS